MTGRTATVAAGMNERPEAAGQVSRVIISTDDPLQTFNMSRRTWCDFPLLQTNA